LKDILLYAQYSWTKKGYPMTIKFNETGAVVLRWFVANLLGIAAVAGLNFIAQLVKFVPGMYVSALLIGLPIGFAQWMVLRRVAPISSLWILTVSVGFPLALVLLNEPIFSGIWEFLGGESDFTYAAGYAAIGLLVGSVQWFFLRGHYSRSFMWLLGSACGLGLGFGLVLASDLIYRSVIISLILVILVYAIATGSVFSWLRASNTKARIHLADAT